MVGALACLVLFACAAECPAEQRIVVGGESYCGEPCRRCDDCDEAQTCQFRGERGVCVDHSFLIARSLTTACTEPCAATEARYQGACRQLCNVDGECDTCCIEPDDIEYRICAPDPSSCP